MYCLRYWARYVRKGEVRVEVSKLEMNQPLGSSYLTAHPTQSKIQQFTIHIKKKIERFLAREGVLSGGALGFNTLCRGCSSHTTLVGLLYPGEDKSKKVCTGYKV